MNDSFRLLILKHNRYSLLFSQSPAWTLLLSTIHNRDYEMNALNCCIITGRAAFKTTNVSQMWTIHCMRWTPNASLQNRRGKYIYKTCIKSLICKDLKLYLIYLTNESQLPTILLQLLIINHIYSHIISITIKGGSWGNSSNEYHNLNLY